MTTHNRIILIVKKKKLNVLDNLNKRMGIWLSHYQISIARIR